MEAEPETTSSSLIPDEGESSGQGDTYKLIDVPLGVDKINPYFTTSISTNSVGNASIAPRSQISMQATRKTVQSADLPLRSYVWLKFKKMIRFFSYVTFALSIILFNIVLFEVYHNCRTLEFARVNREFTSWFGGMLEMDHPVPDVQKQRLPGLACLSQETYDNLGQYCRDIVSELFK